MSTGPFASSYETVTLLGVINQFQSLAALNYNIILGSTLNSKHSVNASIAPTKIPTIKYVGYGNGGSYNVDDGNLSQPYKPAATNMDLYRKIPFRTVPVNLDLTPEERANYRLRTLETNQYGDNYYCYWLKPIIFIDNQVRTTLVNPQTNTQEAYQLLPANLNPTAVRLSTTDVVNANASRIVVAVAGSVHILGSEVMEYVNAFLDGDPRRAKIDEIGCYSGEERIVTGTNYQGVSFEYTDAVYVQLAKHKCTIGEDFSNPNKDYTEDIVFENGSIILS